MKAAGLIVLALVIVSFGTAEPGALAYVSVVEEPPVTTEAEECVEDENRQDSAGIVITMTGRTEEGNG